MRILAIESSCDESAVAVLDRSGGLLAHELFSQIDLHRVFGGVVPELASRDHVRRLLPLVRSALAAGRLPSRSDLDGVAYTAGPGLIGALLTGAALARSLAYAWRHARASASITSKGICWRRCSSRSRRRSRTSRCWFPADTRCSSRCRASGATALLGETRDDAAGEAFDKTAKLLGLPYPGGPELARLAGVGPRRRAAAAAADARSCRAGVQLLRAEDRRAARRARADAHGRAQGRHRATPCRTPSSKRSSPRRMRALEETGLDALVVSGGVGANRALRERMAAAAAERGARVYLPAHRVLHGQRRDDRGGGLARLEAGEHDGPGDPGARPLAARLAASRGMRLPLQSGSHDSPIASFCAASPVECIIGFIEWERRIKQTVVIDLELPVDCRRAAAHRRRGGHARLQEGRQARHRVRGELAVQAGGDARAPHRACWCSRSSRVEWVRLSVNKPGAIRGSRDVGVSHRAHARRSRPADADAARLRRRRQQHRAGAAICALASRELQRVVSRRALLALVPQPGRGLRGRGLHQFRRRASPRELPVHDVVARLREIEELCGRPRGAPKWAPRSMDLDILLYGDLVLRGAGPEAAAAGSAEARLHARAAGGSRAGGACIRRAGATIGELWQRFDQATRIH